MPEQCATQRPALLEAVVDRCSTTDRVKSLAVAVCGSRSERESQAAAGRCAGSASCRTRGDQAEPGVADRCNIPGAGDFSKFWGNEEEGEGSTGSEGREGVCHHASPTLLPCEPCVLQFPSCPSPHIPLCATPPPHLRGPAACPALWQPAVSGGSGSGAAAAAAVKAVVEQQCTEPVMRAAQSTWMCASIHCCPKAVL